MKLSVIGHNVSRIYSVTQPILVRRGRQVFHFVLKYRILACASGVTLMYGASCLAECCPNHWSHETWECFVVWPIHAFGLVPVLKPLEAVWGMMSAETEHELAELAAEVVKESAGV